MMKVLIVMVIKLLSLVPMWLLVKVVLHQQVLLIQVIVLPLTEQHLLVVIRLLRYNLTQAILCMLKTEHLLQEQLTKLKMLNLSLNFNYKEER